MENYQAVFKRKEIKYLLSREKRNALLPILEAHMEPDAFAHSSISNLYYDTPDFRMVRRSLEKPMYKEKLRLRSYGTPENTSTVFPEIKKKAMGIVYKRRISLPYQEAVSFLSGQQIASTDTCNGTTQQIASTDTCNGMTQQIASTDMCDGTTRQILHELDWMLASYENLAPRVFLSYERDSYKGGLGSLPSPDSGSGYSLPDRPPRSSGGCLRRSHSPSGSDADGGQNIQCRALMACAGTVGDRNFPGVVFEIRKGL